MPIRASNFSRILHSMVDLEQVFRDRQMVEALLERLMDKLSGPLSFMEVCGTHTMSIFRHGIRTLLPPDIRLVSGPGCPVCVTSQTDIDRMVGLSEIHGVVVATFGDLMRVPGTAGSLSDARARGASVEIVYSPAEALNLAGSKPSSQVVFLSVGFETTAPVVAATVLEAQARGIENFSIYCCNKLMPPALHALFQDEELEISGLLCPGHVSSIIGAKAYEGLCARFSMPCVITGFEPVDILTGLYHLTCQASEGKAFVENVYHRAVPQDGNKRALALMEKVFEPTDAHWRGLGTIDKSGLELREEFSAFDVQRRFEIEVKDSQQPKGCICGKIIRAKALPTDCALFAKACTPTKPVGPCMVSSEGTCSAYYKYGSYEEQ